MKSFIIATVFLGAGILAVPATAQTVIPGSDYHQSRMDRIVSETVYGTAVVTTDGMRTNNVQTFGFGTRATQPRSSGIVPGSDDNIRTFDTVTRSMVGQGY